MSGHTPGPWGITEGDSVIRIASDGRPVAVTDTKPYYEPFDETDEANARLIAAAPELLEELERAVSYGWHHQPALDAIAKAKGQS